MSFESIYNLIPQEVHVQERPPRYISKFSKGHKEGSIPLSGSTIGTFGTSRIPGAGHLTHKDGASFGPIQLNNEGNSGPNPRNFLRKGEGTMRRSGRQALGSSSHQDSNSSSSGTQRANGERIYTHNKPPIPKRGEEPVFGIRSSKDYVTANAVEAILSVPSYQRPDDVNYLEKEDFGKVPEYLSSVKEEVRRENEMIEEYVREQLGDGNHEDNQPQYEHFPEEERLSLLAQLKGKHAEINQRYQLLTHVVNLDSVGQIRRKKQLEAKLDELEKDIAVLERDGEIYIPLDDSDHPF